MGQVNRYRTVVYGSSPEAPRLKAKIELYQWTGESASTIGKIRFHEGELPPDKQVKGTIEANMPASQLDLVIDLLRSETPVYFAFHEGRAVLGTAIEPIGTRDETVPRLVKVIEMPEPPTSDATDSDSAD